MRYVLTLTTIIVLGLFQITVGQSDYKLINHSMVIKGTSNLHNWESKVTELRCATNITTTATFSIKSINSLTIEIPVRSIKSDNGSIMDNKTYSALNANSYANITMKVVGINKFETKPDGIAVNAACSLTIAGVTNRVDIYVVGKVNPDGTIKFAGSKKIKMTDYKVSPPTALLGSLTTGNEVEIVFNIVLKK